MWNSKLQFESEMIKSKKVILNPISMFVIGLVLGIISRLLDIYTSNIGNIFSQMAIWILLGVLISIYSSSKKKAMINIFPFCIGILITYRRLCPQPKQKISRFVLEIFYTKHIAFNWLSSYNNYQKKNQSEPR